MSDFPTGLGILVGTAIIGGGIVAGLIVGLAVFAFAFAK